MCPQAAVLFGPNERLTCNVIVWLSFVSRVEHDNHAVLCCAVLCCAVLCCAVLCCAVLCCAVLCCAVLCCAICSGSLYSLLSICESCTADSAKPAAQQLSNSPQHYVVHVTGRLVTWVLGVRHDSALLHWLASQVVFSPWGPAALPSLLCHSSASHAAASEAQETAEQTFHTHEPWIHLPPIQASYQFSAWLCCLLYLDITMEAFTCLCSSAEDVLMIACVHACMHERCTGRLDHCFVQSVRPSTKPGRAGQCISLSMDTCTRRSPCQHALLFLHEPTIIISMIYNSGTMHVEQP